MNDTQNISSNLLKNNHKKQKSGWDVYFDALLGRHIAQALRPWYVRHLKSFQNYLRDKNKRLDKISEADLVHFLKLTSAEPSLKNRYFKQLVEALEIYPAPRNTSPLMVRINPAPCSLKQGAG